MVLSIPTSPSVAAQTLNARLIDPIKTIQVWILQYKLWAMDWGTMLMVLLLLATCLCSVWIQGHLRCCLQRLMS